MKKRIGIGIGIVLILLIGGMLIYLNQAYEADNIAQDVFEEASYTQDGYTVFESSDSTIGFIFYPGAQVEPESYSPLLKKLSNERITTVLVEMPFNLAIFNNDAAKQIIEDMPQIEQWYIGGHSLGGAMASSYAASNENQLDGLVLLGAYAMEELTIPSIAIYGSEDLVLSRDKLALTKNQFEIPGGNHAYFGNYGEQEGDGKATITHEQQQNITVEKIKQFIFGNL